MDCSPPDSSVSVEFSRQEYRNGLLSPTPEDFPDPGIRPTSPVLVGDSLPLRLCVYTYIGKAHIHEKYVCKWEKIHRYFICKSIYLGIDTDVKVLDSRYTFPPLPIPTSTLVKGAKLLCVHYTAALLWDLEDWAGELMRVKACPGLQGAHNPKDFCFS